MQRCGCNEFTYCIKVFFLYTIKLYHFDLDLDLDYYYFFKQLAKTGSHTEA